MPSSPNQPSPSSPNLPPFWSSGPRPHLSSGPEARSIPAWGEAPGNQPNKAPRAGGPIYNLLRAFLITLPAITAFPLHAAAPPTCREAILEGTLEAGQPFSVPLGNGLRLYFQPIHSGWITRVLPLSGPLPAHDYAELATPPYQSVTPLSLSTDFSFRAQDAVGWNPRRFRFATSPAAFRALESAYNHYTSVANRQPGYVDPILAAQIGKAAEATLTILDARLTPGTADQWLVAASVASHFLTTAHTLVPPPDGVSTPLGRLLSLRFRLTFTLPPGFVPAAATKVLPAVCSSS